MDNTAVTLHKNGKEVSVPISQLAIPDCWHVAMRLREAGDNTGADQVLDCWHKAHSFKQHIVESE